MSGRRRSSPSTGREATMAPRALGTGLSVLGRPCGGHTPFSSSSDGLRELRQKLRGVIRAWSLAVLPMRRNVMKGTGGLAILSWLLMIRAAQTAVRASVGSCQSSMRMRLRRVQMSSLVVAEQPWWGVSRYRRLPLHHGAWVRLPASITTWGLQVSPPRPRLCMLCSTACTSSPC